MWGIAYNGKATKLDHLTTLKYHESFESLMAIIEKIQKTETWNAVDISHLSIILVSVDLDNTYKEVARIVKLHMKDQAKEIIIYSTKTRSDKPINKTSNNMTTLQQHTLISSLNTLLSGQPMIPLLLIIWNRL